MKILTIDDIQQSYLKLLLKHFKPFQQTEVSLFLSPPFQLIDEDPDYWCYTTIVYKAVSETLHAISTNWGVALPFISISDDRWWSWETMINTIVIKAVTETLHIFRQIEVPIFLSSPFPTIDEDPDNWWYTTIVNKAVTALLHAVSTNCGVAFLVISISNNRWRCWQMTINSNRN